MSGPFTCTKAMSSSRSAARPASIFAETSVSVSPVKSGLVTDLSPRSVARPSTVDSPATTVAESPSTSMTLRPVVARPAPRVMIPFAGNNPRSILPRFTG